jgi:hypothetical protein
MEEVNDDVPGCGEAMAAVIVMTSARTTGWEKPRAFE